MLPTAATFRAAIQNQIDQASARGATHVSINAGDLHRMIGGYPGLGHRLPACCATMRKEMREGDEVIAGPPKGLGASLTIRYKLPRLAIAAAHVEG